MRVGLPHIGNTYIPFKALMESLDADYVIPPLNSQHTLSLGVRYSPEDVCLPFKLILGNLIEAAGMGADSLIMPGGYGICRLGYYAKIHEAILRNLGYQTEMIRFGLSEQKLSGVLRMVRHLSGGASWGRIASAFRFGLTKLTALDRIEKKVQEIRAYETTKGMANQLYSRALTAIDGAGDYASLKKVTIDYLSQLNDVSIDSKHQPLIVGITGEIYVLLEPFANLDLESELGKLGVLVRRQVFLSNWIRFSWFLNYLGLDEHARVHRAAKPYLKRDVGGDGWESVGDKVLHAGEYDGLIHLAPFTCMPETVAQNIMKSTREHLPVLTILCDEQMGKTGLLTRLEAFCDLLEQRRRIRREKR
ncbi:MAG: CoA protein activase [Chloroflexota bacterium]